MPATGTVKCSPLLLRPLLRLLQTQQAPPQPLTRKLAGWIEAGRPVGLPDIEGAMAAAVGALGDPALGLSAAMHTQLGDFEALEWVSMSAGTWREATETACRYGRILSETANFRMEVCESKSHLMLGSVVPLSRTAVDYLVAAYHLAIQLRVGEVPDELEIWFEHPQPDDLTPYRALFGPAALVFGAAFNGFVSDAARLDQSLPTANPSLYKVLQDHADALLAKVASGDDLSARVSQVIVEGMRRGNPTAARTASRLGMTRRTLSRRLMQEGTSYSDLLQKARYRTAIHYLQHSAQSVEDIAFLLGYSECPPFVRAFKRWSGLTPMAYRQRHRPSSSSTPTRA